MAEKADELAALDPLPHPIRVLKSLRTIDVPPAVLPLLESVLAMLAAHASLQAAVSRKFELYTRCMSVKPALMLPQNVLNDVHELTIQQVYSETSPVTRKRSSFV